MRNLSLCWVVLGMVVGCGGQEQVVANLVSLTGEPSQSLELKKHKSEELRVLYIDGNNVPIGDADIEFRIGPHPDTPLDGAGSATIVSPVSTTDGQGVARTTLVAGEPAKFAVLAWVMDTDVTHSITVTVTE